MKVGTNRKFIGILLWIAMTLFFWQGEPGLSWSSCDLTVPGCHDPQTDLAQMLIQASARVCNDPEDDLGTYFKVTLENVPLGNPIDDGIDFPGWCVEKDKVIRTTDFDWTNFGGNLYDTPIYSSLDPPVLSIPPPNIELGTWNSINWILNSPTGNDGTKWAVTQLAIWFLVDGTTTPPPAPWPASCPLEGLALQKAIGEAAALADEARANAGFVPGPGQDVALILPPTGASFDSSDPSCTERVDDSLFPDNSPTQLVIIETKCPPETADCSIGDFVWEDADRDGCQGVDERPIEGVEVKLFEDCGNPTEIASTTTNAEGFYEFTGLDCGKEYRVQFGPAGNIYDYTDFESCLDEPGNPSTNDPTNDSDCNRDDNGFSGCVTFPDPENEPDNPTIDCGYVCGGKIGDFVFLDENEDGCQDNEPGIPMVDVTLSEDCDNPENSVIATTSTDENGSYMFTGLCPGNYFVEFGNDLDNTRPGDCRDTPSSPNDPTNDSNCGDRELQCVGLTRNNPDDPTIDCGKEPPPCPLEVEKTAEPLFIDCVTGTDGVDTGTDGDCIVMCDSGTDGLCIAETVTYTITVTNPSETVTVSNIIVDDEVLEFMAGPFTLEPGESEKFTLPGVCVKETTKNTVVVTVDGEICDTAMAEVTVDPICPDDSAVTASPTIDLSDNKKVKWELTNNGPFDVFITKVVVTWPDAADEHDMLKKFKLDGDFAKDFLDGDSPTIVPLEKAFEDDADKRRLEAGKSEELEIEFEEEFDTKADRVPEDFSIYVLFDTGQVLTFNLP